MVLRYWGQRDVFPEDFAALVGPGHDGILTGVLASAVRDRGWQALVMTDDDPAHARIRAEIDRGRPVIALIEVGPRTYHYVVIVGGTDRAVVLHDPARAPFQVMPWIDFDRAWTPTARWLMLVLPADGFRPDADQAPTAPSSTAIELHLDQTPCGAMVERGVQMARTGKSDEAEQSLVAATALCPNDPDSWRELAGWRFSQSRWAEAEVLALTSTRLAPDDGYTWQLVGTSRYLTGDTMGALEAWNHNGEPRVDTIEIHGAERTRQPVIVRAAALKPRQVLTPDAYGRALGRLQDLPVAANARLRLEPIAGGRAKIDVFLDERQVVPRRWFDFAALGARALVLDEMVLDVAGPLGAGDAERAEWRWSARRPRVALGLSLPSPQWLRGVLSLDGLWERQSYDATPASVDTTVVREERRGAGLHVADWSTRWLRWRAGAGLDRLREYAGISAPGTKAHDYLAMDASVEVRPSGNRVAFVVDGGWWTPFARGDRFATLALLAAWRSTANATLPSWSVVTSIGVASRVAPLALWQGAGTGPARSGRLRAHPLLDDHVLTGPVFGRGVVSSTLEYARPVGRTLAGGLSIAAFADTARAWHRLDGLGSSPLLVDAGGGVRIHGPGPGGTIRIDLAHGLRGGGTTLSAGWGGVWPR
jgi:Peptidase_C39 like family